MANAIYDFLVADANNYGSSLQAIRMAARRGGSAATLVALAEDILAFLTTDDPAVPNE